MAGKFRSWAIRVQRVTQGLLGLQAEMPTDVEAAIRVVAEARAIRFWEEFDEGIIRWMAFSAIGATVGEVGRFQINGVAQASQLPTGTIWTLDRIIVSGAGAVGGAFVRINSTAEAGGLNFFYSDQRWAPIAGVAPMVGAVGTAAAGDGTTIAMVPTDGKLEDVGLIFPGIPRGDFPISIDGVVANAGFNVWTQGRVILPPKE